MIWTVAAGFARMRGAAGGAVILSGLDGAGISSIFAAGIASHGPLIAAWPRMSGLRRATSRREAAHSVTPRAGSLCSAHRQLREAARPMARSTTRLDDAARAAWFYCVAGNTQDQIAAKLGVSRQSAQRLAALAMSEGLAKVRIEHPIARRLDLSEALPARFGLKFSTLAPSDPASGSTSIAVAGETACDGAVAVLARSDRHGHRRRAHLAHHGAAAARNQLPPAPRRVADGQHRP
jgi:hypothetical protein